MLIGISGRKRSGKDTVADRLVNEYGFVRVSFAQPLKDMLYALNPIADVNHWDDEEFRVQTIVDDLGWEQAKDCYPEIRQLLQRLGTEAGRNVLGENVWVDLAIKETKRLLYNSMEGSAPGVVITDMRFPNELDAVWRAGGFAVRVERPGLTSTDTHASETALDDIRAWSLVLRNDSTIADLHQRVDEMHGYFVGARVNA